MKKKLWCWILLACLLMLPGCTQEVHEEAPELLDPVGVTMDTAIVEKKDISKVVSYTGVVEPEVTELYFEMDGVLDELKVHYGDTVKKGDVIAVLDQESVEKQVKDLESQIAYKQKVNGYSNQRLQYEINICQTELNKMQAAGEDTMAIQMKKLDLEEKNLNLTQTKEKQNLELTQLNAQLAKVKEKVGVNELTAPHGGTIVYVDPNMVEGRGVSAFDPIIYITNEKKLYISSESVGEATVENADSIYAKIGNKDYNITLQPFDNKEYVSLILAGGKPQSHFSIDNIDEDVKAGDYVVILVTSLTNKDTLAIPSNALYADDMGHFVYKIVDGRRERCNVQIGISTSLETQILDGLQEGDEVYVAE